MTFWISYGVQIRARIPDTAQLAPAPPLDPDEPNVIPLPPAPAGIEIVPFLGTASTEHIRTLHSLYASQAATLVWASSETAGLLEVDRKDVVVGIALRRDNRTHSGSGLTEYERRMFHGIMGLVKEVLVQG